MIKTAEWEEKPEAKSNLQQKHHIFRQLVGKQLKCTRSKATGNRDKVSKMHSFQKL